MTNKLDIAGFDWDAGNREKCAKHGISVAEIEAFLLGESRVAPDLRHSAEEQRFLAVGRSRRGRAMFVVFTIRKRGRQYFVRPISARYMHKKEIERYEEEEGT